MLKRLERISTYFALPSIQYNNYNSSPCMAAVGESCDEESSEGGEGDEVALVGRRPKGKGKKKKKRKSNKGIFRFL